VGWAGVVGPAGQSLLCAMLKNALQNFFFAVRFKKTQGKECLCRAFFEKRTAKVFS
jgi:hypothetical protein